MVARGNGAWSVFDAAQSLVDMGPTQIKIDNFCAFLFL